MLNLLGIPELQVKGSVFGVFEPELLWPLSVFFFVFDKAYILSSMSAIEIVHRL